MRITHEEAVADGDTLWLFAYGSLVSSPEGVAAPEEIVDEAKLLNFSRDFCILSTIYRGTSENPGLTLGLVPSEGSHCEGVAMKFRAADAAAVFEAIDAREMVDCELPDGSMRGPVYQRHKLPVQLPNGCTVECLTYVADPNNKHTWRDGLEMDDKVRMIATAEGRRGRSAAYLAEVVQALQQRGVPCENLLELHQRVEAFGSMSRA
mgnify:CR=1 FL=1